MAWEEVGDPYEQAIELVRTGTAENVRAGIETFERLGATRALEWARRGV